MAGLTNADRFEFVNLEGDELELFGSLLGYTDTSKAGLVEKQVVRKSGALHQRVGSPPQSFDARVLFAGPGCRAEYERVRAVMYSQPEGRVTHPRWGSFPAVLESVGAAENPDNELDAIYCTLRFVETGLRAAPKPSPAAKAQAAAAQAESVKALTDASGDSELIAMGAKYADQAAGYAAAMQAAVGGLGILADVDASLYALRETQQRLQGAAQATQAMRGRAVVALSLALTARNRLLAGQPPMVRYTLPATEGLLSLCQRLYGARALEVKALIERSTRLRRPYALPAGTELLLPDPAVKPPTG